MRGRKVRLVGVARRERRTRRSVRKILPRPSSFLSGVLRTYSMLSTLRMSISSWSGVGVREGLSAVRLSDIVGQWR